MTSPYLASQGQLLLGLSVMVTSDHSFIITQKPGKLELLGGTKADQMFPQAISLFLSCLSAIDCREIPAQPLKAKGSRGHRSASHGPQTKSGLLLIFVNKIYWSIALLICLQVVCGCFYARTAEL